MIKFKRLEILLILVLYASCSKTEYIQMETQNNLTVSVSKNIQNDTENKLFDLINEHRTSIGLNELQFESTSYEYASAHTDYMITTGMLSHDDFDMRSQSISAKTGAVKVSENVAKDYKTAEEAMSAWLNSTEHRINLEGNYTHSALSIKANTSGELFFTQIFIR